MAVLLRKNEDDPEMDGETLQGEVVLMEKEYKDKLESDEHIFVCKKVYIT